MNSPWRHAAAALAVTAAAAHLPVIEDHLESAPVFGVLFVAFSLSALVLAVLLVRRDVRWVWRLAMGLGGVAVATYITSRAIGLPQITDDVGDWTEPLGIAATVSECLLVMVGALALAGPPHWVLVRRSPIGVGVALLALGLSAAMVAGSLESSRNSAEASMSGHEMAMSGSAGGTAYWDQVSGATVPAGGRTRRYYIGADEVAWNYAPTGKNVITGQPFSAQAQVFVGHGPDRIGSDYLKCLYHGYTDSTFSAQLARSPQDAYLGFLGPVIRAEVGDTIVVTFRNNCRYPASIHPHGVLYTKDSEGAPYVDGTSGSDKLDDAVPQGKEHVYTWKVPQRAGPGPGEGSSVMWMYHSHTDEVADTYAGLMGPMEITAKGMARADGSPKDVDRSVFELFSVMNENLSSYLPQNVKVYTKLKDAPEDGPSAEEFQESNMMHSINGYVYGNQPMLTLVKGQHVRWYTMSMGNEVDLHTPHWHGNTVVSMGMRVDTVSLLPAEMVSADMVPDNVGTWLFHCHVNDHIIAGMITRYTVTAK